VEEMTTTYSLWAAAYAVWSGVLLVRVIPGRCCGYVLGNRDGRAAAAIDEWVRGDAVARARELVDVYNELLSRTRSLRTA
jgi:hypothetical protein